MVLAVRTDYWYAAKASCFFRMNSVGAALGRGLFAIAITVENVLSPFGGQLCELVRYVKA
jgi:hypothetical protein